MEKINRIRDTYWARNIYDANTRVKRAVDTLIDGTVPTDDEQRELFHALLDGTNWHRADHYFLLLDFEDYRNQRLRAIYDAADRMQFGRKGLMNLASAGTFSSDRTIAQYAEQIWHIEPSQD